MANVTISDIEHEVLVFGAKLLAALKAEGIELWDGFERAVARVEGSAPVVAVEADAKVAEADVATDVAAATAAVSSIV
jgi:hypothetical protein